MGLDLRRSCTLRRNGTAGAEFAGRHFVSMRTWRLVESESWFKSGNWFDYPGWFDNLIWSPFRIDSTPRIDLTPRIWIDWHLGQVESEDWFDSPDLTRLTSWSGQVILMFWWWTSVGHARGVISVGRVSGVLEFGQVGDLFRIGYWLHYQDWFESQGWINSLNWLDFLESIRLSGLIRLIPWSSRVN